MIGLFHRRTATPHELAKRSFGFTEKLDNRKLAMLFAELRRAMLSRCDVNSTHPHVLAAALAANAIHSVHQIQPYEVQHQAALVMAQGGVAEMATGEGKTIAVAIAATIIAASGRSVHVATSNEYLATRDHEQMNPVFKRLGLRCGLIDRNVDRETNRDAYACDITYGTANGFAFDHLGDLMLRNERRALPLGTGQHSINQMSVCRRRHAILIDEIDHCLIDEAVTPLVLSSSIVQVQKTERLAHAIAANLATQLERFRDWTIDEASVQSRLTQAGVIQATRVMPTGVLMRPWTEYVTQALDATYLLRADIDYVIHDAQIIIIDRATGRLAEGRQWQSGLYQAVQQKESIAITAEPTSAAQSTHAKFLSLYSQVSGCSGTAWDCRQELKKIYTISTTKIEPRLPSQRIIFAPKFFATAHDKWQAIVHEVCETHAKGRPVLVGTRTIHESKLIAACLTERGLKPRVLNGVQDENEASVIAQAGQHAAITVATDMAGRGTDIFVSDEVAQLGGLHVLVSEPRHSIRLDRQLIGRCARQGQPGTSRTFIAADDSLLTQHGQGLARYLRRKTGSAAWSLHADNRSTAPLWNAVLKAARRSESRAAAQRAILIEQDRRRQSLIASINSSRELTS